MWMKNNHYHHFYEHCIKSESDRWFKEVSFVKEEVTINVSLYYINTLFSKQIKMINFNHVIRYLIL